MRPRVLWLSQLASPEERVDRCVPYERDFAPGALPGAEVTVVDVAVEPIPDSDGVDAVVVGGSVGCALDQEPWRVALRTWLQAWHGPFLGICGGHQLYALAQGGEVGRGGFEQMGLHPLSLPGLDLRWVCHAHRDAVTRPPPGADVWAADDVCIQALRYGRARWTTQFHPEITDALARHMWAKVGIPEVDAERLADATAAGARLMAAWLAEVRDTLRT